MADDPNQIDPFIQSLIDKNRQQQQQAALAAAQQSVGNPTTYAQGIPALGTGLINMLQGFKTMGANQNNIAMGNALAGGVTPLPQLPAITPQTMISPGSASTGSLSTPSTSGTITPATSGTVTPASTAISTTPTQSGSPLADAISRNKAYAAKVGVDPNLVAGIMLKEGPGTFKPGAYGNADPSGSGKPGTSFGEFQMRKPGLGSDFEASTGLKVSDPANRDAVARYAIDYMAAHPDQITRKWTTARDYGIAGLAKIGAAYSPSGASIAKQQVPRPESYGVPHGQVAGPGAPSDIEPTTPEGRAAALGAAPPPVPRPSTLEDIGGTARRIASIPGEMVPGPTNLPRPVPQNVSPVAIAPQPIGPTPSSVNPALSPTPMGPLTGLSPPGGGGHGAAAGAPPAPAAPPVTPQVSPTIPAAVPPGAARPIPSQAPATGGGSAYDPRTGRFLTPGEQIPGYAPAPMSSTGGPDGGLGGLLASLFGGGVGSAQAAPRSPTLASGLGGGGAQTALPQAGPARALAQPSPQAPVGAAPVASTAGAALPLQSTNPLLPTYASQYEAANRQYQQLQQNAYRAGGTPWAVAYQKAADAARSDAEEAKKGYMSIIQKEQERAQPPQTASPGQGILNPQTGKYEVPIPKDVNENQPAAIKEFEYAQKHPEFARAPKWVPNASTGPLGEPVGGWVYPPNAAAGGAAPPVAPAVGNMPASDPTKELTDEQKAAVGTPNSYTLPKIGGEEAKMPGLQLTPEQEAKLAQIPPERQGMVRAILANDMELPKVTAKNKLGNLLNEDIRKIQPGFDAQSQAGRVKAKAEFLSGGNQSLGKQIEFGDTAISHLGDVPTLSDNVDEQLGSPSEGVLSNITGGAGAQSLGAYIGSYTTGGGGALDAIHAKALTFSGELSKYLTGGEGTEAQREEQASFLSGAKTTYERKLNALGLLDTIAGRKDFIQAAWHNAAGPNVADFPVMSPVAQKKMDAIREWATTGQGAVDPVTRAPADQSGSAIPAAPAPQGQPPSVLPQSNANTYASGTTVVPGSTVGNTPSNTRGMLRGEQDTIDPYLIFGSALAPVAAMAAPYAGRLLARGLSRTIGHSALEKTVPWAVAYEAFQEYLNRKKR